MTEEKWIVTTVRGSHEVDSPPLDKTAAWARYQALCAAKKPSDWAIEIRIRKA